MYGCSTFLTRKINLHCHPKFNIKSLELTWPFQVLTNLIYVLIKVHTLLYYLKLSLLVQIVMLIRIIMYGTSFLLLSLSGVNYYSWVPYICYQTTFWYTLFHVQLQAFGTFHCLLLFLCGHSVAVLCMRMHQLLGRCQ